MRRDKGQGRRVALKKQTIRNLQVKDLPAKDLAQVAGGGCKATCNCTNTAL